MSEFPQIAPMPSYADVGGAADWLVRAFGFEERDRIEDPERDRWMLAQAE